MQVNDSQRLTYKLMSLNDGHLMLDLDSDPAVMKYINGGTPSTLEEIEQLALPRLAKYSNSEKGWGLWNAFIKESGEFIGWILVRPMNFFSDETKWNDIELGWRFKQSTWGKGYATEAAKQVMAAIGKHPDVDYFTALAETDNIASIKVMEKIGMSYVKTDIHRDSDFDDMEVVYYTVENK